DGSGEVEGQIADDDRSVEPSGQNVGVPDLGPRECVFKMIEPRFVEFHESQRTSEPVELVRHCTGAGADLHDGSGGGTSQAGDRGDGGGTAEEVLTEFVSAAVHRTG